MDSDSRIDKMNEAFMGEFTQNMCMMAELRSKISGLDIGTPMDLKMVSDALEKMATITQKTYDMHRKALGLRDDVPSVQVNNTKYVMLMPAGVKDQAEWSALYGNKVIENAVN